MLKVKDKPKNSESKLAKWKKLAKIWKEILDWKIKYATQKRFFSLEENEQKFLETTYISVVQICPELTWKDYLNHLRKSDNYNKGAKSVVKLLKR